MLALILSPNSLYSRGMLSVSTLDALAAIRKDGTPVYVVTNQGMVDNEIAQLTGRGLSYKKVQGRQKGHPIKEVADDLGLKSHDVLVLAINDTDMQMAKVGGAILIEAAWSTHPRVAGLGIKVDSMDQLREVINVTRGWTGQWWYEGRGASYSVRALVDVSSHQYVSNDQAVFGRMVTNTVKNGGVRLTALLGVTCRSLLMDNILKGSLFWGVYPSSSSVNDDTEVLSDFVQRLRTTVSGVHYAKRGEPLFVRHTASIKRSRSGSGDRTDPANQIETLHLNPEYQKQLKGRTVIVVDDCTTYGVSFAVAAAFLFKAGVRAVYGVALGKFGNKLTHLQITIDSDPFLPVDYGKYRVVASSSFDAVLHSDAQAVLQAIIT